ncbi:MAG TPA: hypothetical protein PLL69_10695, partial [Gemmatimonadales bacterium]|nr:hypothetical protein [Gemmatimonadales bacterium]
MSNRNLIAPGLCLALAAACGGDPPQDLTVEIPAGVSSETISLLRLPAGGGEPSLYRPASLARIDWNGPDRLPAITRPLGFDPDDEMVYGAGKDGAIIGLDMLARRFRSYLPRSEVQSGTQDGMVLVLDSANRALRFDNRTATSYRAAVEPGAVQLVRGTGGRINAYNPSAGLLQVLGEEGEIRRYTVPSGHLSSSWFGDLLIIVTDSGLVTIRPAVDSTPSFERIRGNPVAAVPSPSAHRIYLARGRGDLLLLDRFTLDEVGSVQLPGVARELRPDRSGRWLLARAETGDTAWVVDLVSQELVAPLATTWQGDLPLIVGGTTLIARSGKDVAGWDITSTELRPTGRITDGSGDHYLLIDWRPGGRAPAPAPAP